MPDNVSLFRLYLLRALFLLNFALLGLDVWSSIISGAGSWEPVRGVAVSLWGRNSVGTACLRETLAIGDLEGRIGRCLSRGAPPLFGVLKRSFRSW